MRRGKRGGRNEQLLFYFCVKSLFGELVVESGEGRHRVVPNERWLVLKVVVVCHLVVIATVNH